jgi:hypothetical protein
MESIEFLNRGSRRSLGGREGIDFSGLASYASLVDPAPRPLLVACAIGEPILNRQFLPANAPGFAPCSLCSRS